RVDIPEGGVVAAGDPLVVVEVPRSTLAGGDTAVALERRLQERREGTEIAREAQLQLLDVREAGLQAQLAATRREIAQAESEIATRRERVEIARQTLGRLGELQRDRYVSELQVTEQEAAVLDQVSALQALEKQLLAARRLVAQLGQSLRELPGQRLAAEAGFRRDIAVLAQEQVETRARSVDRK